MLRYGVIADSSTVALAAASAQVRHRGMLERMNPLVPPLWLAARLADPGTLILDATLPPVGVVPRVDTRSRYAARHIPGAVFFDIDELSDDAIPLPHMLPAAEDFARSMSALGAGDGMTMVVYEQEAVFSAPRAWWMLRTFGVKDVYVLDGGLAAWIDAGLPTQADTVQRAPAIFTPSLHSVAVKSFQEIRRSIGNGEQIVDARAAGRFAGTAPEPRPGIQSGHMPNSISLPYTHLLESRSLEAARGSSRSLHC